MTSHSSMSGRFLVFVLSVVVAFTGTKYLCGAETPGSTPTSSGEGAAPSATSIRDEDYRIQVDDILMIDGHRSELSLLQEYAVAKDGTIKLIYLHRVKAAGLTKRQLEEQLEKLYDPRFFKNVVITVTVKSKTYDIGGEVQNTGTKQLVLKTTLVRAILSAGGPTDYADLGNVTIDRRTGGKTTRYTIDCKDIIKGKAPDNFFVEPNDLIWVPRKGIF